MLHRGSGPQLREQPPSSFQGTTLSISTSSPTALNLSVSIWAVLRPILCLDEQACPEVPGKPARAREGVSVEPGVVTLSVFGGVCWVLFGSWECSAFFSCTLIGTASLLSAFISAEMVSQEGSTLGWQDCGVVGCRGTRTNRELGGPSPRQARIRI